MDWNDLFGLGLVLGLVLLFIITKHFNDKDRGEDVPFGCGCGDDAQAPGSGCAGCPVAKRAQGDCPAAKPTSPADSERHS